MFKYLFLILLIFTLKVSIAYSIHKNLIIKKSDYTFLYSTLNQIQNNYVGQINSEELMEKAVDAILCNLDPHSEYLSPQNYNHVFSTTQGEFGGLGLEIGYVGENFQILSIYEGSPGFNAGLKNGDIIVSVDNINPVSLPQIEEKLRGRVGSTVQIVIYREPNQEITFNIQRGLIQIIPVKSKLIANNTIAYLKINNFNEKSFSSVETELLTLLKLNQYIEGLIIDLRWNGGGLLDQCIGIANLFLKQGEIVTIKPKNLHHTKTYTATGNDIINNLPLVVLVNSSTASGAEIVAGALQDNKRALIVGTKTFGKGSVQELIPLQNGGAMKLTVALYYTPSGRSIQALGIIPNIEVSDALILPIDIHNRKFESSLKKYIENKSFNQKPSLNLEDVMNILKDEKKDFQLLIAINTIKIMNLYNNQIK